MRNAIRHRLEPLRRHIRGWGHSSQRASVILRGAETLLLELPADMRAHAEVLLAPLRSAAAKETAPPAAREIPPEMPAEPSARIRLGMDGDSLLLTLPSGREIALAGDPTTVLDRLRRLLRPERPPARPRPIEPTPYVPSAMATWRDGGGKLKLSDIQLSDLDL